MHSKRYCPGLTIPDFFIAFFFMLLLSACGSQRHMVGLHGPSKPGKKNPASSRSASEEKTSDKASLKTYQKKYSSEFGTSSSEITDLKLYQFIDEWMNAPYKYGGLSKTGIDCSGLSALLMKAVYDKKIGGSSADIFNQAKPISKDQLEEGDLVFFKIKSTRISHMGVYLVNDKFIHATTKAGVIISDLNDPYYSNYFYKAGRIK